MEKHFVWHVWQGNITKTKRRALVKRQSVLRISFTSPPLTHRKWLVVSFITSKKRWRIFINTRATLNICFKLRKTLNSWSILTRFLNQFLWEFKCLVETRLGFSSEGNGGVLLCVLSEVGWVLKYVVHRLHLVILDNSHWETDHGKNIWADRGFSWAKKHSWQFREIIIEQK